MNIAGIPFARTVCCGDYEIRHFRASNGELYYLARDVYRAMGYIGNYNSSCLPRVKEYITQKYCIPRQGRNPRKMYVISANGLDKLLKGKKNANSTNLLRQLSMDEPWKYPQTTNCPDIGHCPENPPTPNKEQEIITKEGSEKELYELTIEGLKGALKDKDRRIDVLERRVLEYENKALFYSGIKILEKQLRLEG